MPETGRDFQVASQPKAWPAIAEKPGVIDGRIEARHYLSLTATIDHDLVAGAPAARFLNRLSELLESGCGLADE